MQIQPNVTRKVTDEQKKDCYVHNILCEIFTAQIHTCIAIGLFHCLRTSVSDLIPNNT